MSHVGCWRSHWLDGPSSCLPRLSQQASTKIFPPFPQHVARLQIPDTVAPCCPLAPAQGHRRFAPETPRGCTGNPETMFAHVTRVEFILRCRRPCSFDLFSQIKVFFSHNKPVNSAFNHNKPAKRTLLSATLDQQRRRVLLLRTTGQHALRRHLPGSRPSSATVATTSGARGRPLPERAPRSWPW
jgi:hypothetical protein